MKIVFDATQQYQLDAVAAVLDVFNGQPRADQAAFFELGTSELFDVLAVKNQLVLSPEALLGNVQHIQERNWLTVSSRLEAMESESGAVPYNFSIEMETGTGKTYVYLRSIFELHRRFGFAKFIIAVPSVAIREGVLSSLRLMRSHFIELFDNTPFDAWVYDSKQVSRLRGFADSRGLQILIINIDAFNKSSNNIIFKEADTLSGLAPIEFIRSSAPIVIVDEPQNFEADSAKKALAALSPLCTLRFSATHKNAYNCLYQLDFIGNNTSYLFKARLR
jgi:type III restriction enzyme